MRRHGKAGGFKSTRTARKTTTIITTRTKRAPTRDDIAAAAPLLLGCTCEMLTQVWFSSIPVGVGFIKQFQAR